MANLCFAYYCQPDCNFDPKHCGGQCDEVTINQDLGICVGGLVCSSVCWYGSCVECSADSHCGAISTKTKCNMDNKECVECTQSRHCTNPKRPLCNEYMGICGECLKDSDCPNVDSNCGSYCHHGICSQGTNCSDQGLVCGPTGSCHVCFTNYHCRKTPTDCASYCVIHKNGTSECVVTTISSGTNITHALPTGGDCPVGEYCHQRNCVPSDATTLTAMSLILPMLTFLVANFIVEL